MSRRCRAPRSWNGCAIASSSFCAIRPSIAGSSKSSTITMNSSPPRRASRSVSRSAVDSDCGHLLQQLVADPVAERVVDVLEAVEVDEQHADAAARCASPARSPAPAARAAAGGSADPVSASRVAMYCSRSSAWMREETSCTNDRIDTMLAVLVEQARVVPLAPDRLAVLAVVARQAPVARGS